MDENLIQELISNFDVLLDYVICMQAATKYKNGKDVNFAYLARLSNKCKKEIRRTKNE